MKNIVALVDFSDVTAKVLEQAGDQAKAFDARVILLHVVPKEPVVVGFGLASPVILQSATAEGIRKDYARLETLRGPLTERGVDVLVEQLTDGTVEKLMAECRMWNADLIVIGTHHRSPIYQWFMRSYTGDILQAAHCPVLVVPAEEAEE
jgi:nucleotide-binding universal stress UspA family protein